MLSHDDDNDNDNMVVIKWNEEENNTNIGNDYSKKEQKQGK
ncbi:MAG TPA: hypothetical protein VJ729_04500 [Nitrososphaeraceae archaeon]|nr:hypothetical protein [Nitrososphaeraceae archaeon]